MTNEFKNTVLEMVNERISANEEATINPVQKNNTTFTGLTIKSKDCNIAPTIYLDGYYEAYCHGKSLVDIVEEIIETYEEHKIPTSFNASDFLDFEKQKENIRYKVVNYGMNEELLSDVPHIKLLDDLAITFYVDMSNYIPDSTVLIRNSHMDMWNTTVDELYELADKNSTLYEHYTISSITDVLSDMLSDDEILMDSAAMSCPMYVMSNDKKLFAATSLLKTDILKKFCDKICSDLWVIGSSIHEILLVPASLGDYESISDMMAAVNADMDKTEVLATHPYYFSRNEGFVLH